MLNFKGLTTELVISSNHANLNSDNILTIFVALVIYFSI